MMVGKMRRKETLNASRHIHNMRNPEFFQLIEIPSRPLATEKNKINGS